MEPRYEVRETMSYRGIVVPHDGSYASKKYIMVYDKKKFDYVRNKSDNCKCFSRLDTAEKWIEKH